MSGLVPGIFGRVTRGRAALGGAALGGAALGGAALGRAALGRAVLGRAASVVAVGLAALTLSAACAPHALVPPTRPVERADAIVVLGNRPPVDADGNLRPELRRRIETGVRLYHEGVAPRLVMTGGPAPSGHVEAEVMREHAIALGVPEAAITIERASTDTIENAGFTLAILCGDDPLCTPRVVVVTSPYHLRRAGELFACAGADVQLAPTPLPDDDPGYARRFAFSERFVRVYYGFIDECERAALARRAASSEPARAERPVAGPI
ncbi:MAG: YdcF family protein [Myxococcales bacterium]|nr:YdcF family protein [Myxococcales bacterium]